MKELIVVLLALSLSACASSAPTRVAPQHNQDPAAKLDIKEIERLAGTWAAGQDRLFLDADLTYHFERERVCDLPPCPIEQTSGSFTYTPGQLKLATVSGPPFALAYSLDPDPRRITLKGPEGRRWVLTFVE